MNSMTPPVPVLDYSTRPPRRGGRGIFFAVLALALIGGIWAKPWVEQTVNRLLQARKDRHLWRQLLNTSIPSETITYTEDPDLVKSFENRADYIVNLHPVPQAMYMLPLEHPWHRCRVFVETGGGFVFVGKRSINNQDFVLSIELGEIEPTNEKEYRRVQLMARAIASQNGQWQWHVFQLPLTLVTLGSEKLQILAGEPLPNDPSAIRVQVKIDDQDYCFRLSIVSNGRVVVTVPKDQGGFMIVRPGGEVDTFYTPKAAQRHGFATEPSNHEYKDKGGN